MPWRFSSVFAKLQSVHRSKQEKVKYSFFWYSFCWHDYIYYHCLTSRIFSQLCKALPVLGLKKSFHVFQRTQVAPAQYRDKSRCSCRPRLSSKLDQTHYMTKYIISDTGKDVHETFLSRPRPHLWILPNRIVERLYSCLTACMREAVWFRRPKFLCCNISTALSRLLHFFTRRVRQASFILALWRNSELLYGFLSAKSCASELLSNINESLHVDK